MLTSVKGWLDLSSTLFDYEWQFLLQMVSRINYSETYTETCDTILQQMRTLIPFQTGIIFQAARENGRALLNNPISTETLDDSSDHTFFTEGNYPHWNEFIMAPYSIVFRQSDIISPSKMEKTRVYREIWQQRNIYWGLFVSLVYKDCPLAVMGLMRDRTDEDFSARDIYIMNTLKDPLERKFYSLLEGKMRRGGSSTHPERIAKTASRYGLTKRETEIVALVCSSKSSEDMCQQLYITHATLSKHLSNIYSKTKVRNRTQLFGLFNVV
jgi:DNA-binding CsgD family transcriptional regulator